MTSWRVITWFSISIAFYCVGGYLSKMYANSPSIVTFFFAVIAFSLCSAAWMPAIREVNMIAVLGMVWSVAYAIVDCTIGFGMFGEQLTTMQSRGIIFGIASIVMLSM